MMRLPLLLSFLLATLCLAAPPAPPAAPAPPAVKWHPGHYVFVASQPVKEEHILEHFRGVQRIYTWNSLEPAPAKYDFSAIKNDLALLKQHNKQLVIQFQYKAFGKDQCYVPADIRGPQYGGGVYRAHSGSLNPVMWNAKVAARMDAIIAALGREFDADPNLEAVNLPETAPSADLVRSPQAGVDPYTPALYVEALKGRMLALRKAFPNTAVIQYTNFPPSALPDLVAYMKEIGVGMGGPDVYPRESDLAHPQRGVYRFYPGLAGVVPLGAAVQFPDYSVANWKRTAASNRGQDRDSVQLDPGDEDAIPVREHLDLARNKLKLNYLFWHHVPTKFLNNVKTMLAEPDLANDPAGGLNTAVPSKLRQTSQP